MKDLNLNNNNLCIFPAEIEDAKSLLDFKLYNIKIKQFQKEMRRLEQQ